jgi:hypothetical protein
MSYITKQGEYIQRRPARQRITAAEAMQRLNTIIDDTNAKIAKMEAERQIYEDAARLMAEENENFVAALNSIIKAHDLGAARGIARKTLKAWSDRKL